MRKQTSPPSFRNVMQPPAKLCKSIFKKSAKVYTVEKEAPT